MRNAIKSVAVIFGALIFALSAGPAYGKQKKDIVFGYSAPMSGSMGDIGQRIKNSYTVWQQMVNAKGGIYVKQYGRRLPVKLIMYDDQSDPTTAAKLYEKLITQDKVDFVLSPYGSSIGFPVSGICQKYKMPIVFAMVSSDAVFKQHYDHVFCLIQPASRHCWTAIQLLKDPQVVPNPPKKLMFLASKELYNVTAAKGGVELAKKLGFQTDYEEVAKGAKDFSSIITKAKSGGYEGVVAALYPEDFYLFLRQMMEFGYHPKYFDGMQGADLPGFWKTFGKRAQGIITIGVYGASWPTYQNKEFVQKYEKEFGITPEHYDATSAVGQVMEQAIEKAGTLDKNKVEKVLETSEFKCILYPRVKFVNEDGYTNINKYAFTGIKQWQNGKCLTVFPKDLASAKFIYPLPKEW